MRPVSGIGVEPLPQVQRHVADHRLIAAEQPDQRRPGLVGREAGHPAFGQPGAAVVVRGGQADLRERSPLDGQGGQPATPAAPRPGRPGRRWPRRTRPARRCRPAPPPRRTGRTGPAGRPRSAASRCRAPSIFGPSTRSSCSPVEVLDGRVVQHAGRVHHAAERRQLAARICRRVVASDPSSATSTWAGDDLTPRLRAARRGRPPRPGPGARPAQQRQRAGAALRQVLGQGQAQRAQATGDQVRAVGAEPAVGQRLRRHRLHRRRVDQDELADVGAAATWCAGPPRRPRTGTRRTGSGRDPAGARPGATRRRATGRTGLAGAPSARPGRPRRG